MAATANKLHFLRPVKLAGTLGTLVAMGFASSAQALDWKFDPSVAAYVTYTDNVNQSPNNADDAIILSVSPGFTLQSEGSRRVEATVSYYLSAVTRFGGGDDNDLNHNLNASGKAELVEDLLFIDADAQVSQELISLLGSPAGADINSSNRATVGSYSVSPYLKKRFGSYADGEARYTLSGALFGDDAASNLVNNELRASLNSGSRFNILTWGMDYSYRDVVDRDSGLGGDTSYSYERANLSLGYALNRKFRLIGNVGHEWLEYDSATASANDRDDPFWSAGFAWSPSRRTSLEATMGQRFFGNTYSLSASYRARITTLNASYVEDVNDIAPTLTTRTTYVWNCNGSRVDTFFPIAPAPGCVPVIAFDQQVPSLTEGPFVSKTLSAGVTWVMSKVSYALNLSDIRRLYLLQNNAEDRSQGINASVNYRLSPLTNLYGNLGLTRTEEPASLSGLAIDRKDDLYSFIVGVNHEFGRDLSGALTYRYYQRDSNDPAAEYTENNITASVNLRF